MIRLIQRRLIIPQGDTGTFTIPVQGSMTANDVAILSIYDPLTRSTVLNKKGELNESVLDFSFIPEDTLNLEPSKRYQWDITIYRNASYDSETQKITPMADISVDSYYAAFSLPTCEIRTVTTNVQK